MDFLELLQQAEIDDKLKNELIASYNAGKTDFTTVAEELEKANKKATDQEKRAKKAEADFKKLQSSGDVSEAEAVKALQEQLVAKDGMILDFETKTKDFQKLTKNAAFNTDLLKIPNLQKGASEFLAGAIIPTLGVFEDGVFVKGESGAAKISTKTGKRMTAAEAIAEKLEGNSYFVKGGVKEGSGSKDNLNGGGMTISKEAFKALTNTEQKQAAEGMTLEQKSNYLR